MNKETHNQGYWDRYFMERANIESTKATCKRRQVGAVIVNNKRAIIGKGSNGAPGGVPTCIDNDSCVRDLLNIPSGQNHEICAAVHAEQNALISAARHGISIVGSTIYTNTFPCYICAKMIVNAGIKRVVYSSEYPDSASKALFELVDIEVVKI